MPPLLRRATAEASWDNAMRLIIHDPRYGALKALGEKKSAFNEYCTVRSKYMRTWPGLEPGVCLWNRMRLWAVV